VPKTAGGFLTTIGALQPLHEREGVIFHYFSLQEDRFVRLLLKNHVKRMPEAEISEELKALDNYVQA
jgi:hypothetical protein